ncbi:DUF3823 domain-containing protein [Fulvivirga sediminis]|uniref:DUF3823 domain-containing protein n=1 Tax=Fulvivirga sediminis TaxID=2803949 RepID=A0A937JXV3_9BACT|nr:DUF3823 domain-containing protein [Fulvivirga sediminis]MBL3655838.1 DUF3823 domain-containing protein [Fulvivirga sediminis]
MKKYYIYLMAIASSLMGCQYDNFEEPKAMLSGNVIYNGEKVGVDNKEVSRLELWQDGYDLDVSIPIYMAQDGSYSVSLFDGEYKMVRKSNGPWVSELSDTLYITVKGNTVYDVPVTPYFTISDEKYNVGANGAINASFSVNKIIDNAKLKEVKLFFGYNILIDNGANSNGDGDNGAFDVSTVDFIDLNQVTATIPEALRGEEYLFVRMGVKSSVSDEFYYTQVQKVSLK